MEISSKKAFNNDDLSRHRHELKGTIAAIRTVFTKIVDPDKDDDIDALKKLCGLSLDRANELLIHLSDVYIPDTQTKND